MGYQNMLNVQDLQRGVQADLQSIFGVIRATGAEARSFLHAQLTQDVLGLTQDDVRLAGYCSPKGRLYAVFQMYGEGDDVYLIVHRSVLENVLKRLRMFVLRAKVVLEDVSETHAVHGVCGDAALAVGQRDGARLGILPAHIEGVSIARELRVAAPSDLNLCDAAVWQWLDVMAGLPQVEAATYEAFVPQMVNLERIGGVNFKKGCYPGQEIVARSHYLGKLKRRMVRAQSTNAAAAALSIGMDVCVSTDAANPIGQLVGCAANPLVENTIDALFEVSLPMLEGDALLSTAAADTWRVLALPYSLKDEQ